ncbi:tetratricopeptide repeat protein [Catellatospora paridis]
MSSPETPVSQVVTATAGFAYGVIGADLHVFGDGSPVYVLENWRPAPPVDSEVLRELPSRMLNARNAVVEFTGRDDELASLLAWRGLHSRLAVRWLHGPGGQGKSRLAARFAEECLQDGWKVVNAVHGPGVIHEPQRQEDLTLNGAAGILLVVDYADRWPITHLTWLLSNALLHQVGVPSRVLLIARSLDAWPRIAATLANQDAGTSAQALRAISGEHADRETMFKAARDSFARHYGLATSQEIRPPDLSHPDFGLVLGIHMAALVAVDAATGGRAVTVPEGLAGLTIYLLHREQLHWALMHAPEAHRLHPAGRTFLTPPETMNQAVFIAALTGAVDRSSAVDVVARATVGPDADQVVADHAACYPPPGPDLGLEPLYPDRLAEDFLALTVPGHEIAYPAQSWARPTVDAAVAAIESAAGASTSRPVLFLAAAAARWPHVGHACLFPLLEAEPSRAFEAGSAALSAVASLPDVDPKLLETLARHLPDGQHLDLDTGAAALVERLTDHQLPTADAPRRAQLLAFLGQRLAYAGRYADALGRTGEAVTVLRDGGGPADALAQALNDLSNIQSYLGRPAEAASTLDEAVALQRTLLEPDHADPAAAGDGQAAETLAEMLSNKARLLIMLGDAQGALSPAEEAVRLGSRIAPANPSYLPELAGSVGMLATALSELGQQDRALEYELQAIAILRPFADSDAPAYLPELADSLNNVGVAYSLSGRPDDAMPFTRDAVEFGRRLAKANPEKYTPSLALYLDNLGVRHTELGDLEQAGQAHEEAAETWQRLAVSNPEAYLPGYARALHNLSNSGVMRGLVAGSPMLVQQGLENAGRAVALQRDLAAASPAAHQRDLAERLSSYGFKLAQAGRADDGLTPATEAVAVLRGLDGGRPSVSSATALLALATIGIQAGTDVDAARVALREGRDMSRALIRAEPGLHEARTAGVLCTYAAAAVTAGQVTAVELEAADEAIELCTQAGSAATDATEQEYAVLAMATQLRAEMARRLGGGDTGAEAVLRDLLSQFAEQQAAGRPARPAKPRSPRAEGAARLAIITAAALATWIACAASLSHAAPVWLDAIAYAALTGGLFAIAQQLGDRPLQRAPRAAILASILTLLLGGAWYTHHGYDTYIADGRWAWVLTVAHLVAVLLIVVRSEYLAAWFVATMRLHPFLDDGSRRALARRPQAWALWAAGATVSCAAVLLLGVLA